MTESQKDIWNAALGEIEVEVSQAHFATWFKKTSLHSITKGVATIRVPNAFTKEWLQNKYNKLILRSLRNISSNIREIQYTISLQSQSAETIRDKKERTRPLHETIALEDSFTFNDDTDRTTNLNPRYTFDSFVVAPSNELASAAAQSVVKTPGKTYNPLFIYGGVGLGKTHLLQAIGNTIANNNPNASVLYVSSETFTDDFIVSMQKGKMNEFKKKYRSIDVLIIDDVQFLAGKEQTQQEFFQTFNDLYQNNKQIILSSDRAPKAISTLEDRLRSRFEGGMIADIIPPDFETRLAILRKKVEERESSPEISNEILEHIATTIQRNVRELEGALTRILGIAELQESRPSMDDVRSVLKSIISAPHSRTTPATILQVVADYYNVSVEELCNRSRRKGIVKPRQIAMYLLRTELESSFPAIGECLGNRDHTTAMYAFNKIEGLKENDDMFNQELETIQHHLYSEKI